MECIVCSAPESKVVPYQHRERNGGTLNLYRCKACNHVFQSDYKEIYTSGEFTEQARNGNVTPDETKIAQLDKRAIKRHKFYEDVFEPAKSVFEIGSSIGSFLNLLHINGKEVFGIEPDPDYCEFGKERYGIDQTDKLLEDFKVEKKYDLVCSFHVIEHVQDPKIFASQAAELLDEGGTLLIECPSYEMKSYGRVNRMYWQPHIHYFSMPSMYRLLCDGFEVKEMGFYGDGLYVIARKSKSAKFQASELSRWKRKSRKAARFIKLIPDISFKSKDIKPIAVLWYYHRNRKELTDKVKFMAKYFFKERKYVRQELSQKGAKTLTHLSYYRGWENQGDTALSKCVRSTIDHFAGPFSYRLHKVTAPVTPSLIDTINNSDGMVLGGGGVFLPDTNKNDKSGWQWAISKEELAQVKSPVILYSVGYNYFHGQEPNEFFIGNLKLILEKSAFFGLRNHGSIRKVSELVGEDLAKKISFQPCTTTVIRQVFDKHLPPKKRTKRVAFNMAFDRYHRRFGSRIKEILHAVAHGAKELENRGYEIINLCHLERDALFELALDAVGVNYETVNLQYYTPIEAFQYYNDVELTLGMRGHAQMIPFGVNCKIISLSTHKKMGYFLEDIGASEWLIDLKTSEDITKEIVEKSLYQMEEAPDQIEKKIQEEQQKLYEITKKNMEIIRQAF